MPAPGMSPRSSSLLLLLLPAVLTAVEPAGDDSYCCLPLKWHSQMLKTNQKVFKYLQSGQVETETATPLSLDIFVNHRRPRFELRTPGGGSLLFWRGHMWRLAPGASQPHLLNPVARGYRPSGGFAPLFFRCLAAANGFVRLNSTHYRMTEPDESQVGRRLRLATVTDVFVTPADPAANHSCHLREFAVTSAYPKYVPGRGPAIVQDTDAYHAASQPRTGWPDQTLTGRTRAFLGYYRALLRAGRLRENRPQQAVPVLAGRKAEFD